MAVVKLLNMVSELVERVFYTVQVWSNKAGL